MRRRLALLPLLLLVACSSRQPGSPVRPGYNVYSKDQDIQLGRQAAQQVSRQVDVVDDPALQRYVQEVGRRLSSQPAAQDYPYSFTLINDPSINAFALPGGPIFVHSGLIRAADNEAQMAGVLAHEISHVALRHSTNQASKANILQIPAAIAGVVLGQGSVLAQAGQIGLGLGLNSLLLKYSRDAETQADALGTQIMAQAGYNPIEMARFFEKLEAEGGNRAPQFLSSHPNPGNRVRAVQAELQALPQRQFATSGTGDFADAKSRVARLPEPRRPVQQASLPAAPAGGFRQLETGPFTLSHPAGWEAFQDGNTVVVAPRQGLVQNGRGGVDIGYGAMLGYHAPRRGGNLGQATADLLQQFQAGNPDLQVTRNPRRVQVDGSPALLTNLTGASPFGGSEQGVLLTVARPQGLFYMVLIAPQQNFGQLSGTFEQMLGSIRFRG